MALVTLNSARRRVPTDSGSGNAKIDGHVALTDQSESRNQDRVGAKKETHRLHLLLTEKSVNALDVLQDRLEASTTSEAVRRSILLTLAITDSLLEGGRLVVEHKDGTREILLVS